MHVVILTWVFALALAGFVYPYSLTSDYEWPDNSTDIEHEYITKEDIKIVCLEAGTADKADWALTADTDCYIPVSYLDIRDTVKTCSDDFLEDDDEEDDLGDDYQPTDDTESGLAVRANDYPYKGKCSGIDDWKFYRCECVSFAAWRVRNVIGIGFHNYWKDVHWGNANHWDNAAKSVGVKVTKKPKKKTVSQRDSGSALGHVVWITKVSTNKKYVNLEEYNYAKKHTYGRRTKVAASNFRYIHFKR
ncbi:unnamed protein product [Clonostachys solani]|uniref:Peptidase C51 domain-containing protein n=1 Tax=Clonostachys solani TaxID=160281 RepID=A0A9N9ZI13_9HYPO|nr:unnamed protein product [Clonostachys solani]